MQTKMKFKEEKGSLLFIAIYIVYNTISYES